MAEEDEERIILMGHPKDGLSISAEAEEYKNINDSVWAKEAFETEDDIRDLRDGNTFFMNTLILPRKHLSDLAEEHIIDEESTTKSEADGGDK